MSLSAYEQAGIVEAGEPSPGDPATAEETQIAPDRLELLGEVLARRRDKWVEARQASGVEKRWMEDVDQYTGRDAATKQAASMMDSVEAGYPVRAADVKPQRSTVFVNITRPKTNAAEARLANMLFPVDDKNWGIKPTPNPSLVNAALDEAKALAQQTQAAQQQAQQPQQPAPQPQQQMPQQMPAAELPQVNQVAGAISQAYPTPSAQAQLDIATRKAKAMENEIADSLIECDYNAQGRLMLHDCAVLGTGIMKGPIVVNRVAKSWVPMQDGRTHVLQFVQHTAPASERVDPWNVYPDPSCGEDPKNGVGIYERKNFTGKQLRELASQPGYLQRQISKVLEEGPQKPVVTSEREKKNQNPVVTDQIFELWEYWGEFTPEDMRACGIDMPDGETKTISGCIILVNKTVIKGFLNPDEDGGLPYDFMQWEKVDGSCWGYGIPYLCRPAQKVLNAAWRQMMDNAGLSVGPNVVVKPSIVQPADGVWQVTGRKIWNLLDDSVDARTAFNVFEMPNNTKEFEEIINLALKFADEESGVPMLAQGERGTAPETVGGMTILMNSANVVLTRMAKQFDDCITRPHIRRYYNWFMAYSDKPEIKGDFQVDARGSSALLMRDMQQQALIQLGQFQGSIVAPMVNWNVWFKEVLKAQHIDPADIMKTDAEIEKIMNQPPQPSPEQIKAQVAVEVAKIKAQADLNTAKARESGELAYAQTERDMAQANAQARIEELRMKRELALLDYAQKHQLTLEQVKADLAKSAMQEETKRQLAAADLQLRAAEGDKDRAHQQLLKQSNTQQ